MGGVDTEPQEQHGEADLLGPGCLEQRRGTGSDGEGAQSPQMSPDQRRAEAGGVSPEFSQ